MENTRVAYFSSISKPRGDAGTLESRLDLKNDAEHFWELAGPHRQKLYHFIHKSLSFSTEADDVYQDTLLRGLRYFPSYDKGKSFSTWLFTIAHNEVKKHFKNSRREIPLPLLESLIVRDERSDFELVREVYRLADGLKPKHKEIFFLFYDSGFSITEISRITGIREGHIKFILNRVRRTLREFFGEQDGRPRPV